VPSRTGRPSLHRAPCPFIGHGQTPTDRHRETFLHFVKAPAPPARTVVPRRACGLRPFRARRRRAPLKAADPTMESRLELAPRQGRSASLRDGLRPPLTRRELERSGLVVGSAGECSTRGSGPVVMYPRCTPVSCPVGCTAVPGPSGDAGSEGLRTAWTPSQSEGQGFESPQLHQTRWSEDMPGSWIHEHAWQLSTRALIGH
jgi:hypothetical protein